MFTPAKDEDLKQFNKPNLDDVYQLFCDENH